MADAIEAFRAGKPVECVAFDGSWKPELGDPISWTMTFPRRPKPEPVWSLPAPPEGKRWHREDWTKDMMPDGWRPLLNGESTVEGDECMWELNPGIWHSKITHEPKDGLHTHHFRTTRPLPTVPKLRAWNKPSDVPLDCWFRPSDPLSRRSNQKFRLSEVDDDGVKYGSIYECVWAQLSCMEYSTDRETWLPCTVLE